MTRIRMGPPISNDTEDPDKVLMNWAVGAKLGDGSGPPPRREDWSREGQLDEVLPFVEDVFQLDVLDPVALIRATPEFFEYPMCDRDPIPQCSFGRITLLGWPRTRGGVTCTSAGDAFSPGRSCCSYRR